MFLLVIKAMVESLEPLGVMVGFILLAMVFYGSIIYMLEGGNFEVTENFPEGEVGSFRHAHHISLNSFLADFNDTFLLIRPPHVLGHQTVFVLYFEIGKVPSADSEWSPNLS